MTENVKKILDKISLYIQQIEIFDFNEKDKMFELYDDILSSCEKFELEDFINENLNFMYQRNNNFTKNPLYGFDSKNITSEEFINYKDLIIYHLQDLPKDIKMITGQG